MLGAPAGKKRISEEYLRLSAKDMDACRDVVTNSLLEILEDHRRNVLHHHSEILYSPEINNREQAEIGFSGILMMHECHISFFYSKSEELLTAQLFLYKDVSQLRFNLLMTELATKIRIQSNNDSLIN
eukprot:TRINITY_DN952_c0_g1_i1.p1 TRINITY_DN952_c0_g1~~TRINITY_DN952_c0_g1_i1.p1  ORF type:complete len:128 (-),score=22.74 TRINITY_DN952_c0_g1_i1:67-450(-)